MHWASWPLTGPRDLRRHAFHLRVARSRRALRQWRPSMPKGGGLSTGEPWEPQEEQPTKPLCLVGPIWVAFGPALGSHASHPMEFYGFEAALNAEASQQCSESASALCPWLAHSVLPSEDRLISRNSHAKTESPDLRWRCFAHRATCHSRTAGPHCCIIMTIVIATITRIIIINLLICFF